MCSAPNSMPLTESNWSLPNVLTENSQISLDVDEQEIISDQRLSDGPLSSSSPSPVLKVHQLYKSNLAMSQTFLSESEEISSDKIEDTSLSK